MLTSVKCILIFCTRLIRDLDARSSIIGILEEIDVRALVKAVMERFRSG